MDLQDVVDWEEVSSRIEVEGRAPSAVAELRELWTRRMPDLTSLARLIRLEQRFGSALLAMDLACWALHSVADRPEIRVLAATAAARAGLTATARRILGPLLCRHEDPALASSVVIAWRDQALASGRVSDLMQALLLAPANAAGLIRLADQWWETQDQDAGLTAYRWAICCGTVVAKAYRRASSSAAAGRRPEVTIEILRAMLRRTGDPGVRARLLVLLLQADRRVEALALLGDGAVEWAEIDELRVARSALVAYAHAQLAAVNALETEQDSPPRAADDRWSPRQRELQKAGRTLSAAGWNGPAIWQLRKAVDGSEGL